jgi:hypothetical protein
MLKWYFSLYDMIIQGLPSRIQVLTYKHSPFLSWHIISTNFHLFFPFTLLCMLGTWVDDDYVGGSGNVVVSSNSYVGGS